MECKCKNCLIMFDISNETNEIFCSSKCMKDYINEDI